MRFNYIISSLVLFPLTAFSQIDKPAILFSTKPVSKNTVVKTYSNESEQFNLHQLNSRSKDYPTQIIRIKGSLDGQELSCDEVNERVETLLLKHITSDYFIYNAYIACHYDPDTKFATQFMINSYFDPISDEAIDYLKTYLSTYNDADLMGTKLHIESAKGLVVSMNIEAGVKKNINSQLFNQYQQDRSNFHFKSNYEMKNTLISDIFENFYSNDPQKILPFLNKWVYSYAGHVYNAVLKDSNYVELQPERIFLMEKEGDIFVSNLKYYFAHVCSQHENHHCLKDA